MIITKKNPKNSRKSLFPEIILLFIIIFPIIISNPLFSVFYNPTINKEEKLGYNRTNLENIESKIKSSLTHPIGAENFYFYKLITVDHTKVVGTGNHINFPLLISTYDNDLRHNVQPDGDDIAFAQDNLWLDHEIELFDQSYNDTHAHLIAWVRIPSFSSSVDTNITMYYGNSNMGARENPAGVWDSNFKLVHHFQETIGSTSYDSTSNSNNGIILGNPTLGVTGNIGNCYQFDDTPENQRVRLSSIGSVMGFTMEIWAYPNVGERESIWGRDFEINTMMEGTGITYSTYNPKFFGAVIPNGPPGPGSSRVDINAESESSENSWNHFVITYNGITLRMYVNGDEVADSPKTGMSSPNYLFASNHYFAYGGYNWNTEEMWFSGKLDEARLSNIARSTEWIATEYQNQNNPESFYTFSQEQVLSNIPPNANDFNYYKIITIDNSKVSGENSLLNFPLLFSILDSDLRYDVQPDGDDIAFAQNGKWLNHEIELFNQTYNNTHAQLITWVLIPFLYTNKNTNITMYYSNSTMSSTQNPSGVWGNYVGVWHLNESPTGTVYDSTQYNNDGTTLGSMIGSDLVPGQIGSGFDLDGIDDMISVSESSSLDSVKSAGTLSIWINWVDSSDGGYQRILTTTDRFDPPNYQVDGFEWAVQPDGDLYFYPWGGGSGDYNLVTDPFTNGIWQYVVLTLDYSTKSVQMYLDGNLLSVAIEQVPSVWTQLASLDDWLWGGNDVITDSQILGKFDEIRASSIVRSSSWIVTEYNNQYNPDNFYSISQEQKINIVPSNTDYFNYYKEITTDHLKISGENSLVNFPLLISIFDSDLRFDVQSNGADIAFAQNGKWLSHEIEKFTQNYNSSHAQFVAWVRIPYLYPLESMNITMYYGNSSMTSRENPSDVWVSNYVGIWHLKEDPSGTPPQLKDSSIPASDGFSSGTMTSTDQVPGMIGVALDFDGNNDYINYGITSELQITGELTVQAWFKADNSIADDYLIAKWGSLGQFSWCINFESDLAISPNGWIKFCFSSDGSNIYEVGRTQIQVGQWYHVVGVFKPNEYAKFFLNGSQIALNTTGIPPNLYNPSVAVRIARRSDAATNYFDGIIDEARISNITRSNDWILTEYNNQYNPQSFFSVGKEQFAKEVMFAEIQVNVIDLFGNLIPNVNISMYYYTLLTRIGISNINGNVNFSGIPHGEYNFTASIKSDIGNHLELVNRTLKAVSINESFQMINLICNVGSNLFEVEDKDGTALDSGWIIVGNSTHNLRNCTIDSTGKARFWWVNTTPYDYNYTVYYQNNQYRPNIINFTSGNINIPNSTIEIQVELTTVDFAILTFPEGEPISGIKIKLRLNDTFGVSIVNLTADQNGIASLRWLTSSGLNGNYSVQLEYYGENKQFNKTTGGPYNWTEYSFEVVNKLSLEFRILISLAEFQTELVSLIPSNDIIINWGSEVLLRILFNITKAGGATHLLGPLYADLIAYQILLGATVIQTGTFNQEIGNVGRHQIRLDTINLNSKTSYLLIISAQKSGFSLPSNLILQLSILENVLFLNQSENDDSAQSVYWLESTDFSVQPYGVASEEFAIQEQLFQDENHNFVFSLSDIENQWNISQVIFNIYNILWTVGPNDINITIIDPYGQFYMFHASNHTGENYLLGEWTGISINLNKNSPTLDNNFEFIIDGSFSGTVDIIADAYFIRDKIKATYSKVNITDTISIESETQGWAIKEIRFDLFNCYDKGTWSLINPLNNAHLNITTNEGFKYSLDIGYENGTGSLIIDNRLIYPLSGEFIFTIESTLDIVFDIIIHVDYVQEFYLNEYLERVNSSLCINDVIKGGLIEISIVDNGWIEQSAILKVNGINNGGSYFLPSELAMSITIGGQTFSISDLSRGYGAFSLIGYSKDITYSAIITTNQQVDFMLEVILGYSRTVFYEILGTVSYTIVESPSIQGQVSYNSNLDCYLQTIDTSLLDADDYRIRFSIIKEHYISNSIDLELLVLSRLTLINGSSSFLRKVIDIYVMDAINFTLFFTDQLLGLNITNLDTKYYIWEKYDENGIIIANGQGTLIPEPKGFFILDFDTEIRTIGSYLLIVTLDKTNYEYKNAMIFLTINKRSFTYILGDNFDGNSIYVIKGNTLPILITLTDPTKENIPLTNTTILLTIDGSEYEFQELGNGSYLFNFPTTAIDAFFTSTILTGKIIINKANYTSQEFQISIMVEMEQIFPGMPTFYFIIIISAIIASLGSITAYRIYKNATIPIFVKKSREMRKSIDNDREISDKLLYKQKEAFVGELVKEKWDQIGIPIDEILGVKITKMVKPSKKKVSLASAEKRDDLRPLALVLMRWNERIGTEIVSKYPEDINLSDKTFMQIYSTHEYSGEKGFITLLEGNYNIVSYYSGPEKGYYLVLILNFDDDPDAYENGMLDALQTILLNLEDDSYEHMIPALFQRLSLYPTFNYEQLLIDVYQNEVKNKILTFLREDGVILKSELMIWLKDEYLESFIDLDMILKDLMKMEVIKQISIKGLPSEMIVLTHDIIMLRIPPTNLIKNISKKGLPPSLTDQYLGDIEKFFREYHPTEEDNLKVANVIMHPPVYESLRLLRSAVATQNELEKLKKRGVDDIYSVIKSLWDNHIIRVYRDKNNIEYYALLTDFYIDTIFPKYLLNRIKTSYEQKSKSNKMLTESLKTLEETYINLKKDVKKQ